MARVESHQVEGLGWWCGIVAPVLVVAGFFSIDDGEKAAGPEDPIRVLVDEVLCSPGRIVAGSLVGMMGALLLVWFGSSLRTRYDREGDSGRVIGFCAFGFIIVMTVSAFIHGVFRLSLAAVDDRAVLSEAVRSLAILESLGLGAFSWGTIGFVLAMSLGSFGAPLLPRAMAVIGVLLSVAALAFTPTNRGGFALLLMPWIVVASGFLLRQGRSARPPTAGG